MTVVFLDGSLSPSSPWTVPSDWSDAGHTVELVGCGGNGVKPTTPGASSVPGSGGGAGAYQLLTYLSGTTGTSVPFGVNQFNSSTSDQDTNSTSWEDATRPPANAYKAQCGLAGQNTAGNQAGGVGANNTVGTPSPVTYKVSGSANGGAGGTITATANFGAAGGGGSAGPSGPGQTGGAGSTTNQGGGGGGGGSNGASSSPGASPGASTTGGNGGGGTSGSGGGPGGAGGGANSGTNGTVGGGGGGSSGYVASGAVTINGGNGGPLGNVSNWTQTSDSSTAGAGGGGGGTGGVNNSAVGNNSIPGLGGNYGGGGGGCGAVVSNNTSTQAGVGGPGLIVITYTAIISTTNTSAFMLRKITVIGY